ncbi:uncharacterized protein LOC120425023 [Culex pipiens pallens]|uniref:uncharacterized protein LOC120425023 n=1 Tax=Culex pipiens pallens TaxID=42434 RepID=UPI001954D19E|nr:uncharacterized protein LOC120425023 [Culex pipiens pallens]
MYGESTRFDDRLFDQDSGIFNSSNSQHPIADDEITLARVKQRLLLLEEVNTLRLHSIKEEEEFQLKLLKCEEEFRQRRVEQELKFLYEKSQLISAAAAVNTELSSAQGQQSFPIQSTNDCRSSSPTPSRSSSCCTVYREQYESTRSTPIAQHDNLQRMPIWSAPEGEEDIRTPSAAQTAARQVMADALPTFYGDPKEWTSFINMLTMTTKACGFTKEENLVRLKQSLRGSALEFVEGSLLLPATVPAAIETLKKIYGRPAVIINSLLETLRSMAAPKEDVLETVVPFGIAVQGFCDYLVAANQSAHLSNPLLLRELVDKLPNYLKLEWGKYINGSSNLTLKEFSAFLTGVVDAIIDVSMNIKLMAKNRVQHANLGHEKGNRSLKLCYFCNAEPHKIWSCSKFKQLVIKDRWKEVQRKGLCRVCLNRHRLTQCRIVESCRVTGCKLRHNTLLHDPSKTKHTY